jgi:hypothetical protein
MQIVDRIEKRRFVGREFLLWLWFESEVFEATLTTGKHGSFGLWVENQLVLSSGKESTRIKGGSPAGGREAKEALLGGKLPETATFRLTFRDRDIAFTLKAERLAISGLKLPTVLGAEPEEAAVPAPPRGKPKKKRTSVAEDAEREADERNESFYERMMLTREVEELIEALYADFLDLRLGEAWERDVLPAQRAWAAAAGKAPIDRYAAFRRGAPKKTGRKTA